MGRSGNETEWGWNRTKDFLYLFFCLSHVPRSKSSFCFVFLPDHDDGMSKSKGQNHMGGKTLPVRVRSGSMRVEEREMWNLSVIRETHPCKYDLSLALLSQYMAVRKSTQNTQVREWKNKLALWQLHPSPLISKHSLTKRCADSRGQSIHPAIRTTIHSHTHTHAHTHTRGRTYTNTHAWEREHSHTPTHTHAKHTHTQHECTHSRARTKTNAYIPQSWK